MFQTEHDLSPNAAIMLKRALARLRPQGCADRQKVRVGKANDGGYVMIDDFSDVGIAYSLGINNDVSWDLEIADRGVEIFQYDHTIDGLPEDHPRFHWQKTGIGPTSAPHLSIETLPNLIAENGHSGRRDMILKCDIEGAEWGVLATMPHAVLDQFRQIVLETHGWERFANEDEATSFLSAIHQLTHNHCLVHVHANNYAPVAVVGGIPIPDVLEMTLMRRDTCRFEEFNGLFPQPIDQPCNPNAADLFIGTFVYE